MRAYDYQKQLRSLWKWAVSQDRCDRCGAHPVNGVRERARVELDETTDCVMVTGNAAAAD